MAEYMNPFAGAMLPENVPDNPFMSRWNQLDNRRMMAPFREMEQERQGMALKKQGVMDQEFMSPEATQQRAAKRTEETEQSRFNAAKAQSDFRLLGPQEQEKILKIKENLRQIEGKPFATLFKMFGDLAPVLDQRPSQMRPAIIEDAVLQFEMQNPGVKIPDKLRQYSPELHQQAKNIWLAQVLTPAHEQAKVLQTQKETANMARQKVASGTSLQVAGIHEAGQDRRQNQRIQEEAKMSPGQFKVRNMRILNSPNSTPEQIEEAEANLMSQATAMMPKVYESDNLLQTMATAAMGGDPEATKRYEARRTKLFEDHLVNEGLRVRMVNPKDSKDVRLVPKSRVNLFKTNGWKEK